MIGKRPVGRSRTRWTYAIFAVDLPRSDVGVNDTIKCHSFLIPNFTFIFFPSNLRDVDTTFEKVLMRLSQAKVVPFLSEGRN